MSKNIPILLFTTFLFASFVKKKTNILAFNAVAFLFLSFPAFASTLPEKHIPIEDLLTMPLEELLEVEISLATKRSVVVRNAPAIASVITAKEIRNMGARNLMDVLKMVPGIGISRNEQGYFMFDMRGISTVKSEKILFMIDGHSLNKNYAGSGLVNFADHLSVENIKQVEIVRGPGSALYGANAFLAVINVITKEAVDLDGVLLSLSGGSFDTGKADLLGGKVFDNGLQVFGSLDYWQTNGPSPLIEKDRWAGNPISMAPGDADTAYEALELYFKLAYQNLTYLGHYLSNDRGVYIGFGNALTDANSLEYINYWHELQYRHQMTDSFNATLKLYWDQFEQDASVEIQPNGFAGSYPNGMIGGPKVKDRTLGGELQMDYDLSDRHNLIFGILYEKMKQYDVRSISNFHPTTLAYLGAVQDISTWGNWNKNVDRGIFATYLQDEWKVTDTLNLTTGLRYDDYSDFGDTINPRIGLVWDFMEKGELKLLYGQAFRAPNFSELYNDNNTSLIGNDALEPEEIKTYEVGIGYQLMDGIRLDADYFYNDIENLIVRDNSTTPNRYANIGGAKIDGIELVLSGDYKTGSYWKLIYSYQDPQDADTHARLANVPYQRAGFRLNYALNEHLFPHVDVLWIDSRPRTAGDPRPDMPSYTTVDFALTVKNFSRNFEIRGVIHNLFDEQYSDPDLSGASQFISGDYPRAGISGMLTATYRF